MMHEGEGGILLRGKGPPLTHLHPPFPPSHQPRPVDSWSGEETRLECLTAHLPHIHEGGQRHFAVPSRPNLLSDLGGFYPHLHKITKRL